MTEPLHIVFLGLSVTSSWGNGHATNYRALMKYLSRRGHSVTFLERDVEWYASNRDLPRPPHGATHLYRSLDELRDIHRHEIEDADAVVVGSYVPDGIEVGRWVTGTARGITAFYDIDTPVTLATLAAGSCDYLAPELIPQFDLYLSFTAGPTLHVLEQRWGARAAHAFHCMVDHEEYAPVEMPRRWELGYLGTYGADRHATLRRLLLEPARRLPDSLFAIAGPQYPDVARWPSNVEHTEHLPPVEHPRFYSAQRFTLNVTRRDMVRAGWSPSVRLFEAAACGVPIISDHWKGIDDYLTPGLEILLARTTSDIVRLLHDVDAEQRERIADAARTRVLRQHTADERAGELEHHVRTAAGRRVRQ
jgi:spore maturation protein CgeB